MTRNKIAIVTNGGIFGGHFDQGVPALMMLAESLGQQHELVVFTGNCPSDTARVARFEVRAFPGRLSFAAFFASITKSHVTRRFDLIHGLWGTGGGRYATLAGKILRIPTVVTLLGGEAAALPNLGYGSLLSKRQSQRLRKTCQRASAVSVLSRFQRQQLDRAGLDTSAFQEIPLGIHSADFPFSNRDWMPPWRFLHVANINAVKDQQTLLRAFDLIQREVDATLTIVGPDYLDGQLSAFVDEIGLSKSVEFVGAVPHIRLRDYYDDAHVLLHSSLFESQAVVALEAMSSGVAVCATRVGLFADLDRKCCMTVPCGDCEGLARMALDAIHNPAKTQQMISAGRDWADAHTADWTAGQYLALYRDLLPGQDLSAISL